MRRIASHLPSGRRLGLAGALCALAAIAGCAPGSENVRDGQRLIEQGQPEAGLAKIEQGMGLEPANHEYRMLAIRQRELQASRLLGQGDAALAAGRLEDAVALYRRVAAIDPNSVRARNGLEGVETARREERRSAALAAQPAAALPAANAVPLLRPSLRKPVSLDFRNADLKAVFDALSRTTGINFVFDREVKPDIKVTLNIANITIEDVIGVLTVTNQLEKKTLNDNTVLIYPNTPAKQKDYLELAVRTFYLSNAEAKNVFTMMKAVMKTKDIYADEKLNTLTMRDTPDAIRLAEHLIAAQDLAEPEVMLEVEVLEVKRTRMKEIGIDPPGKFTVLNLIPEVSTVVQSAIGQTILTNSALTTTQLTLDRLRRLRSASIGIDNPALNLRAENGDAEILANPRIRVRNREKARVLIGDRVPVITTTATANVGTSESVSYLEVGLKLEVEPTVYLDNEVGIKVNLEVSNIVREIRSRSGTLTYQIGTRLANTALRLKDGETQALAGLIGDEDRKSAAGLPWLVDLPVLGRLFSSERSERNKTEIVLLITPRIVRNLAIVQAGQAEFAGGTEALVGSPALRLHNQGKMAMPPQSPARAAAAPAGIGPSDAATGETSADPPATPPASPSR